MKKEKLSSILLQILFFVINFSFLFYYVYKNRTTKSIIIALILLIAQICLFVILKKINIDDKKLPKLFLCFGLIYGLLYIFIMPINFVPDEGNHFRRAYEITELHLVSNNSSELGGYQNLPESIDRAFDYQTDNLLEATKDNSVRSIQYFGNTSLYAFISYTPQIIGILVGKIFNFPMVVTIYLARISALLIFLLLAYFSIKLLPIGKKFLFALIFMPIVMQEVASCSADSLTLGISLFLIALTINKFYTKEKLTIKDKILFAIPCIILSLCKIVYLPICLILFLLPKDCFKSKKDKYIYIIGLAILVILLNLLWLKISSNYLIEFRPGVNTKEQVALILSNPLRYFMVMIRTVQLYGADLYMQMFGKNLGSFVVEIPGIIVILNSVILIVLAFLDSDGKEKINPKYKFLIILIGLLVTILIFTSLYVQWTQVGFDHIEGIQGRYFIPLLIFIPLVLNNKYMTVNIKNYNWLYLYLILISTFSLLTIAFFNA